MITLNVLTNQKLLVALPLIRLHSKLPLRAYGGEKGREHLSWAALSFVTFYMRREWTGNQNPELGLRLDSLTKPKPSSAQAETAEQDLPLPLSSSPFHFTTMPPDCIRSRLWYRKPDPFLISSPPRLVLNRAIMALFLH